MDLGRYVIVDLGRYYLPDTQTGVHLEVVYSSTSFSGICYLGNLRGNQEHPPKYGGIANVLSALVS